jgi:hypothetical protein
VTSDPANPVETIQSAEKDIETRKQAFFDALRHVRRAEEQGADRRRAIENAHTAAIHFFSRIERWVAESSILQAQENPVWRLELAGSCRAALLTYIEYWDYLGRESKGSEVDLQAKYKPRDGTYELMQGMVRLEYPASWKPLREKFRERGLPTAGFDSKKVLRRLSEREEKPSPMTAERWVAVVLGVLFVAALLAVNILIPEPTRTQETTFRIVLALGAGALGAVIPGVLKLSGKLSGFTIRAAGAAAFFFIVYFWNPPGAGQVTPVSEPGVTEAGVPAGQ